jgi:sRNA-binding regulator protein Hfq
MAKKKKGKKGKAPQTPAPTKKKGKKSDPVGALLREHSELTREQAQEIVESGLTYEEWEEKQAQAREERRRANLERMISLICAQYPKVTREQAQEIVELNMTPEEYMAHVKQRKKLAKQQEKEERKQRKEAIEQLLQKYPDLTRAVAGQIASGQLTYEQYKNSQRRKRHSGGGGRRPPEQVELAQQRQEERRQKIEERVQQESHLGATGDSYLQALQEEGEAVEVLRFHALTMRGTVLGVEPFRLIFKTEKNPSMPLGKLRCAVLYKISEREVVQQQVQVDLEQLALQQYPHRYPDKRYQIPEELLALGKELYLLLHNGFVFGGEVVWVDRFQFLLRLDQGGEIFVFRHGVHRVSKEPILPEQAVTLASFVANPPSKEANGPKELPPEAIEVPANFDDYPVKDEGYERLLKAAEREGFELDPIQIRREGDSYVLMDGYRRLTLARENSYKTLPVELV